MKKLLILLVLAFNGSVIMAQNAQTMPDIQLKDVNGKTINTGDYSKNGKITVVSFWATWCTPCKKELTNINDNMLEDWKSKYGVVLVAVCTDNARNVPKVKPYVSGQGWEFDVVMDVNEDLKRALNVVTIPHTFLFDQNGKIVYSHNGYTEGDEFVLEEKIKELAAKK